MALSEIITLLGVLVAVTNIIVEVLKKLTWDKMPTSLLATIVAQVLTISTGVAYLQWRNITFVWYKGVALVVAGFMVAYAAMYGFDKLREIMKWEEK